jgi:hypothetical protein
MIKQMQDRPRNLYRARLLAGILCLLAYSAGSSGTLPQLCALTASLDSSHRARIEFADNAVTVVLSHDQRVDGDHLHRHSTMARWLCVLADQHSAAADHRLQFCSSGTSESPHKDLKIEPLLTTLIFESLLLPKDELAQSDPSRFPSAVAGSLLSAHSTILLI